MSELFQAMRPRTDVMAGELTESRFAAGLEEVVADSAPDTYNDPDLFFTSTYPSHGLRALLNEALGRLSGRKPDGASVIRLETSLGGGKTHNLIALYHAAQGRLSAARAAEFMDPDLRPGEPIRQIGVFVGTSAGATTFPEVDGVQASTIWGYLALQIAGRRGYEHVRGDDEGMTAPGAAALKRIYGDQPTLILIDEIARYYATARGKQVARSTLAEQTTAFLMALMEAVDSLPRAVLVITTTEVSDVFGDDTGAVLEAVDKMRALLARKELVLRPSEEADLPKILARRLFESIPPGIAKATAERYSVAADKANQQGLDLPEATTGVGWANELARTYPFHPALIRVLDKRLSTIPNFQRTRGALRLLARMVRSLWQAQPDGVELIHLHHVDLSDRALAEDLSSRIDRPLLEPVIRADVASQRGAAPSHAELVAAQMGTALAPHLATATYLYSLTRDVPGVPASELFAAVLAPSEDPNLLLKALDALEQSCWYLHADVRGYRFSTEPSLVKLIQEAEGEISTTKARTRATKILSEQFRDAALKVRRAWEDAKIADNSQDAWLAILHWDDFGDMRGVDPQAGLPSKVRDLFEMSPSGGKREFRNRIVFLAPAASSHDAMVRAVRRHLALESLAHNASVLDALTSQKQAEVRERAEASALEARVAVCNHVNILYVPSSGGTLDTVELDVVTTASVKRNQTDAILDRLSAMEKTLAAGDKPLDPAYIRSKIGALLDTPQPTQELVRVFARRTDFKMVLDRSQLVALLAAGVRNGVWEYQDPALGDDGWGTKDRPLVSLRLADDTYLHPIGASPAPKVEPCPLCGKVHTGRCEGPDKPDKPAQSSTFRGSGSAGKAFAEARALAADAGRRELHGISIALDHVGAGAGTELLKLHTVVPASTLGARIHYSLDVTASLKEVSEYATVRYEGTPSDYAPLREALKQILQQRQATLKAEVRAAFEPALALTGDDVGRLAQAAQDTGPGKCTITLQTEEAK